jgi:UDP-N-acetylmuramate dehydrogenase
VPLAPHTTLGVGGPARYFVEAEDEAAVLAALDWARPRALPVYVLGGGSNVVVADGGLPGLVLKLALRGRSAAPARGSVEWTVAAGEPWDDVVRDAVDRGWAGLECLSGIPGLVGATPIQNVGAYGQEVSDTIVRVRALDTRTGRTVALAGADCAFGYRDSRFRSAEPGRYVVLAVTYRLRPDDSPTLIYADLRRAVEARGIARPALADVRDAVLAVRRAKSMVLDPADPNTRSCGSFFLNPILTAEEARQAALRVGDDAMPRWPQPDGRVKLSAAWLIEHAGFARATRAGRVGLSTRHALAVVAYDGARSGDVVAFARLLRDRVLDHSGVRLHPEPILWGFIGGLET